MKKLLRNKWFWIVLVLVAGGAIYGATRKEKRTKVEVAAVQTGNISESINSSGVIGFSNNVIITSDISGEVIELPVKEGDSIRAGQVVVRIKPDNYRSMYEQRVASVNALRSGIQGSAAQVRQASIQLEKARFDLESSKKLYQSKVISEQELKAAQSAFDVAQQAESVARQSYRSAQFNLESAQAQVAEAMENLNKTTIKAPISGRIIQIKVKKGERVVGTLQMAGTIIMEIANSNALETQVNIGENDLPKLRKGDSASINVDALPDVKFLGIVSEVGLVANDKTSSNEVTEYKVKIQFVQDTLFNRYIDVLRKGMSVSVEIVTDRKKGVLLIPTSAVIVKSDSTGSEVKQQEYVYLPDNGTAKLRKVKTGIADLTNIEVRDGLKQGELIVSGPYYTLNNDMKEGTKIDTAKSEGGLQLKKTF